MTDTPTGRPAELDTIASALGAHPPASEARGRMLSRLDAEIAQTAPSAVAARRRYRHRTRVLRAAPLAVVACVVLAIGVPLGTEGDGPAVTPVSAAAEALTTAARAAGADSWRPLDPGEYFYARTLEYVPFFARDSGMQCSRVGTTCYVNPREIKGAYRIDERQLWADEGGRGAEMGFQPSQLAYDSARAKAETERLHGAGPVRPARRSITRVDFIPGRTPTRTTWRVGHRSEARTERAVPYSHPVSADRLMTLHWGLRGSQIDRLSDAPEPEALDRVLGEILDEKGWTRGIRTQPFWSDEEKARALRQQRADLAMQLLGAAPLEPAVRKGLFELLARMPGARLEGAAKDRLGRRGTRLRIRTLIQEAVPSRTITHGEAVAEWSEFIEASGGPRPVFPETGPDLAVPGFERYRLDETDVIVGLATGRLLQMRSVSRYRPEPQIFADTPGRYRVINGRRQLVNAGVGRLKIIEPPSHALTGGMSRLVVYAAIGRTRTIGFDPPLLRD